MSYPKSYILKMNEKPKSKIGLPRVTIRGQIIPRLISPRWLKKKVSSMSSNGPPRNYCGTLKTNLKTCAKGTKLRVYTHVPNRYWSDVVTTAVYLLNCMPTKVLQFQTPLKVFSYHVSLPTVLMIPPRIFGCIVFVHLHKNQRTKFDPCVVRCLFLGYGVHKKGYRCYDPIAKRTYITMDVTFLESKFFFHRYPIPLFRGRSIVKNGIGLMLKC